MTSEGASLKSRLAYGYQTQAGMLQASVNERADRKERNPIYAPELPLAGGLLLLPRALSMRGRLTSAALIGQ